MSNASLELGGGNWAAKDGNLLGYAVGDTSGKYLPREFTFSRGADIGATRVNKDGLIEKYRENLLLQSNQFDTTWSLNSASLTSGQAGYDGSNDAWELKATGDGVTHLARSSQGSLSVSGVSTFSVYVKAGNTDFVRINLLTSGSPNCNNYFDVANGSVGSSPSGSVAHSSITAAGNGFYRISLTHDGSGGSINEVRIQVAEADGDDIPATNSYIYIQDAQLERGLVATDYLESDDETGKAGVLDNLPRIDYTSGSAQLLMEPSRTNYFEQSEYIASNYWFKENATITQNDATSPEGVYNAVKLIDNSTEARHRFSQATSFTSGTDYTLSVFVKKNSSGRFLLLNANTAFNARAALNLDTLEVTNINGTKGKLEDYGNGWYRFSVSGQATSTASTSTYIQMQDSASDVNYVGDGSSFYLYGAQVEAGSYATSYIPNYGTALGVTRNADFSGDNDIVGSPISFGANDDFTLFYEGSFDNLSSTSNMIMGGGNKSLGDAYKNYWWVQNATTIKITGDSEVLMASASMSLNNDTNHKLLVKRDGSTIDFFVDGSKLTTTQSAPNTAFVFRSLGWSYTNSVYKVSGNIKQALVFNSALTDAECIALTTL